jgi:hypothetical protein
MARQAIFNLPLYGNLLGQFNAGSTSSPVAGALQGLMGAGVHNL